MRYPTWRVDVVKAVESDNIDAAVFILLQHTRYSFADATAIAIALQTRIFNLTCVACAVAIKYEVDVLSQLAEQLWQEAIGYGYPDKVV